MGHPSPSAAIHLDYLPDINMLHMYMDTDANTNSISYHSHCTTVSHTHISLLQLKLQLKVNTLPLLVSDFTLETLEVAAEAKINFTQHQGR